MAGWPQARIGDITIDLLAADAVLAAIADALAGRVPPTVLASVNLDHVHHFAGTGTVLPTGVADGARWLTLLDGRPVANAVRRRAAATRPAGTLAAGDAACRDAARRRTRQRAARPRPGPRRRARRSGGAGRRRGRDARVLA